MSEKVEKRVFFVSLAFVFITAVFIYGILVGAYQYWPYEVLQEAKSTLALIRENKSLVSEDVYVEAAPGAPRKKVHVYDDSVQSGFYAILGWDDTEQMYAVWLYNETGKKLHTWKIDYLSLDTDGPSLGTDMPHGMHIFTDGSLVANFGRGGDVMARVDSCGKPLWVKEGIFHHSIKEDDDGALWTWRGVGTSESHHQYIVKLDAEDGSTLEEVSLIDDIIRPMHQQSAIFGVRSDFQPLDFDKDPPGDLDIFHPNDVDVMSADIAGAFPDFEAGDLLLSLRNIHLVAVVDPDSKQLKWWARGPWRFQHDPDFTAEGMISVYNNNTRRARSEIIQIDPTSREITNNLVEGDLHFYSGWMGKHQYLPNGDVLIVSPGEGRVIIASEEGRRLLEFNNVISETHNGHIENGVWLPSDYFQQMPSCT